ncbi:DUF4127 family protein [Oceanobacillus longus]|uniref:DUF4127 family protein n=1 Tax=Oceanobacillus longus TaxID=930120 RepID=A0ABV8H2K4_9BACI
MSRKLALIPVDARPVTYDLPKDLAQLADWELITPPKAALGFLKKAADFSALFQWMKDTAAMVEGFVVSIDMILYGGLVPSRINSDSETIIKERLERFLKIKQEYPHIQIMAFSSTMRLSNSYVNQEEKDYWKEYGKEIWSYSYHHHLFQKYGLSEDMAIVTDLKNKIPDSILNDYLVSRDRNFVINLSLIDYVEQGVIDILIFPQDDTSEYGLNIMEQEQLKEKVFEKNLYERIYIYPGADEVASVLTARIIYQLEEEELPTFYPIYSGMKGALSIAMYEDRPLLESVKGQVYAFGSHTVEHPEEAHIILGVNVPGRKQGDLAIQVNLNEVDTNDRNLGEWVRKLHYYYKNDKRVAIADVAYANGADPAMIPQLLSIFSIQQLSGFAAWNTAGNTIGTAVAQAALVYLADKQGRSTNQVKDKQFLVRLLDDYLYQTIVRQEVRKIVNEEEGQREVLLEKVKELFHHQSIQLINKTNMRYHIDSIYLPWDRTFEIGIQLKSNEQEGFS